MPDSGDAQPLLTISMQAFGFGVYDGLRDFVMLPIRGARTGGVLGAGKGIGKGIGNLVCNVGEGEYFASDIQLYSNIIQQAWE